MRVYRKQKRPLHGKRSLQPPSSLECIKNFCSCKENPVRRPVFAFFTHSNLWCIDRTCLRLGPFFESCHPTHIPCSYWELLRTGQRERPRTDKNRPHQQSTPTSNAKRNASEWPVWHLGTWPPAHEACSSSSSRSAHDKALGYCVNWNWLAP